MNSLYPKHISNPFLAPQLPLFETINVEKDAFDTLRKQIDEQKIKYKKYEEDLQSADNHTFSSVFDELNRIEHPLSKTYGIISHLSSVCDSKALRDVKDTFRSEIVELGKMVSQSTILYDTMKKIKTEDVLEKRVLDISIRAMERGGVNLPDDVKDTLTEIDKQISELTNRFNEHVLDSTKSYKHIVVDENMMKDVPLWARELWNPEDPVQGPWTITLSGPSITAALKHIGDSETRKILYMNYITRAKDNEKVIIDIMDLKLKKANILGFETYTHLSLDTKMADNEEEILDLLNKLQKIALPKAFEEFEDIHTYARDRGHDDLEPWDVGFWTERMREEQFNLKEEELKPYFSLDNVLRELFSLAKKLFGVHIEQRKEKVEIWDPNVRFFDVYDGDVKDNDQCKIIAGFYLDPYVREETKRSGAWMDSCIDKDRALDQNIPVAYLVCNGSPPSKSKPSLMSFSDVETLFHEFGHGLQHMLTRIDVGDISGIDGIEWDAVELPSQFMENWCYEKEILDHMAIHYETGEKMPHSMYESIVKQKNFGAASGMMRQICFAKLDLYLYTHWKDISEDIKNAKKTLWDVQEAIFKECTPYMKYISDNRFLCTFQHIFAGYSAGYYSYKWAEVMSADSFGMFEENPDNHEVIGKKFRDTILANGGSKPAMETFIEFRGRKPEVDALLRHNGLL